MKTTTFLTIILLLSSLISNAQIWEQTIPQTGTQKSTFMYSTTFDFDQVIIGTSDSLDDGLINETYANIDDNGNVLWTKTFHTASKTSVNSAAELVGKNIQFSGYMMAAGYATNGTDRDLYFRTINSLGDNQMPQGYFDLGSGDDEILSLHLGMDYLVYGSGYTRTPAGDKDAFITEFINYWDIVDTNYIVKIGGYGDEEANDVAGSSAFIMIGGYSTSYGAGDKDFMLAMFDYNSRTFTRDTVFGGSGDDEIKTLYFSDYDYEFYGGGYTNSFGNGGKDAYFIKTDLLGNAIWENTYGTAYDDEILTDYGYQTGISAMNTSVIYAGYTTRPEGDKDILLFKVDGFTGDVLWTKTIGDPGIDEMATGVIVKGCEIIITGTKGTDFYATKINDPSLQLSITKYDVNCFAYNDGYAYLEATGGTPPYTYYWYDGSSTQSQYFYSLAPMTYPVDVMDANGCMVSDSFDITQPEMLQASLVDVQYGCKGLCDKTIQIDIIGGIPPYTSYLGGQMSKSNDESKLLGNDPEFYSDLCAGMYSFDIYDENGCYTYIPTVDVFDPADSLTFTTVVNDNACYQGCDGSITINTTGGAGIYSYEWSHNQLLTTEIATGLCAGTYDVIINDTNGCTLYDTLTVGEPTPFYPYFLSVTNIDCYGNNSGAINTAAIGGIAPISYSWSNGETLSNISSLYAGDYSLTITDAIGCTATGTQNIWTPEDIVYSAITNNITCNSGHNGAIDLSVSGGITPYSYLWSQSSSTQDVTSLYAGTYSVTITDANGCVKLETYSLTQPTQISLSSVYSNISCFGAADGMASVTVSGGTSPYTYLWTGGQTDQTITNLTSGTYIVTVTDDNNCAGATVSFITEPVQMTVSLSKTDITCFGYSDGAISSTISGGTSPYSYAWSTLETTSSASGLVQGTYSLTVSDANNCQNTQTAYILEPADIVATITTSNVSCFGLSDGTADVAVTGGTAPYGYSWSQGSTDASLLNLSASSYMVTIFDENLCTTIENITISEPALLTASINKNDISCFGLTDGSMDVAFSGGVSPYTIAWSNGSTATGITGLYKGIYSVNVYDQNGCFVNITDSISEPWSILSNATVTNVLCYGDLNGSINLNISGGTSPFTYVWEDASTIEDRYDLGPGVFNVTVTDANLCDYSDSFTVFGPAEPLNSIANVSQPMCFGNSGNLAIIETGGTSPYSIIWDEGQTMHERYNLSSGMYYYTITDVNSCQHSDSVEINSAPDLLIVSASSMNSGCAACSGSITSNVSGGNPSYEFLWSNGETLSNISGLCGGTTYYLTVTDANGCMAYSGSYISTEAMPSLSGIVKYQDDVFYAGDVTIELYVDNYAQIELTLDTAIDISYGGEFSFNELDPKMYYLRAVLNNPADHPGIISTYYANTYAWPLATPIILGCNSSQNINVNMYEVIHQSTSGGTISGTVTWHDLNKLAGEPVPGAEIYVEQEPSDEPIFATQSDSLGFYEFDNVPYGDGYKLEVDIPGYPLLSTYNDITVSSENSELIDLDFYVDSTTIGGIFIDSVSAVSSFSFEDMQISIYPNPFTEVLTIDYTLTGTKDVSIIILDETGKEISMLRDENQNSGIYRESYDFNEKGLANGMYYVQFRFGKKVLVKRVLKVH